MNRIIYALCIICIMLMNTACITVSIKAPSPHSGYVRGVQSEYFEEYLGEEELVSNDGKAHVISIEQLQAFACTHDSALIYCWTPHCQGESCLSPYMFERYCQDRNLHPILWMNYIREDMIPDSLSCSIPVYFVDPKPFKSDLYFRYVDKMVKYLTGKKSYRYLKYKNGKFSEFVEI